MFSELPQELREKIYEKLLRSPRPIFFDLSGTGVLSLHDPGDTLFRIHARAKGLEPAIIYVSHFLSDGARGALYSMNTFVFSEKAWDSILSHNGARLIVSFLELIGDNANFIRQIEIPCPAFCYVRSGNSAPDPSELDDEILECLRALWSPSPVSPTTLTLNFSRSAAGDLAKGLVTILSDEAWWTKLYSGRGNVECRVRLKPAPGPGKWPNFGALMLTFPCG